MFSPKNVKDINEEQKRIAKQKKYQNTIEIMKTTLNPFLVRNTISIIESYLSPFYIDEDCLNKTNEENAWLVASFFYFSFEYDTEVHGILEFEVPTNIYNTLCKTDPALIEYSVPLRDIGNGSRNKIKNKITKMESLPAPLTHALAIKYVLNDLQESEFDGSINCQKSLENLTILLQTPNPHLTFYSCHLGYINSIGLSITIRDSDLYNVDFSNTVLPLKVSHSTMREGNFSYARINGSFKNTCLTDANFQSSHLQRCTFENVIARNSHFSSTYDNVTFLNCDLSNAIFKSGDDEFNGVLKDVTFRNATLHEINFSKTQMENVDVTGALFGHNEFPIALGLKNICKAYFVNISLSRANQATPFFNYESEIRKYVDDQIKLMDQAASCYTRRSLIYIFSPLKKLIPTPTKTGFFSFLYEYIGIDIYASVFWLLRSPSLEDIIKTGNILAEHTNVVYGKEDLNLRYKKSIREVIEKAQYYLESKDSPIFKTHQEFLNSRALSENLESKADSSKEFKMGYRT